MPSMKWSSLFMIIMSSSLLVFAKITTSMIVNYVKPLVSTRASLCPNEHRPCLTLGEYTSDSDVYFVNNTIFYFYPGNHRLEDSLILENLYNFSFQGLPNHYGDQVVNVLINTSASITWKESWNIKISLIRFTLSSHFTYNIMKFEHSQIVHLSNISIFGNGYSGCSSVLIQESAVFINNSMFTEISGFLGAAVMIVASNVTFRGNNAFVDNIAISGGSIYLSDSRLTFNGTSLFLNNTSENSELINETLSLCNYRDIVNKINDGSGGAIFCTTSYLRFYEYAKFTDNFADLSGGAKTIIGNLYLKHNKAYHHGGAIYILEGELIIQSNTLFDGNIAGWDGGAIYISSAKLLFYRNNSAIIRRSEAYTNETKADKCFTCAVPFDNSITFLNNTARFGGSISCLEECDVRFVGTVYFNHSAYSAIDLFGQSSITFTGDTYFYRNTGYIGGAIKCYSSNITLSGTVYFESNTAYQGGAMFLEGTSKLIFTPKLDIFFISNYANESGGALYFSDYQCSLPGSTVPIECFITIDGSFAFKRTIKLHFVNNSAGLTGSILYGGQFDKCRLFFNTQQSDLCNSKAHDYSDNALETLIYNMSVTTTVEHENSALNISSPAEEIRFCLEDDERLQWIPTKHVYPGQWFNVSLIALGQTKHPVPTIIYWETRYITDKYRLSPVVQRINGTCTNVSFQLLSAGSTNLSFKLYPENPCQNLAKRLILDIYALPCPVGLVGKDSRCICGKKLNKFAQNCYILDNNSAIVERTANNFWIYKQSNEILILHEFRCPLDYCTNDPLNVSFSDPYVQCDFNRTGTLCGQCQKKFSLALGSLHCLTCDNNHASLIVPFAAAGIALITIIFLFQLTVSVGTLSGLFFYANIIQANHQAFFPRATTNFFAVFRAIFVSWLNLDLGIETCFYDGMDIYAYSWFQFLFPFYVWFLVGCVVLTCRYSQSIAKHLGQNPVAVLATLLLMSYSKILQAIIVPLSFTHLTYYNSSNDSESRQIIWLYEGSIEYFKTPRHIALGLFAILSLVMFVLPYISLLLFGHWLQGCSHWWILSWLNKLKPFMDAYHAPYKKHTRHWTGLLLLSRLGLFLTFAINANGSESVNLLAVSSVCLSLFAIKLLRVYESMYKDILESSFILNLGIFSMATFYLKEESKDDKSQLFLSSISVGIAFITFIGILLFHMSIVLKSSSIWEVHMLPFIQKSLLLSKILRITPVTKDKNIKEDKETAELQALPTSTEIDVDLREPLLEITESQIAA